MRVLLDTNILIEELRGARVLDGLPARWTVTISAITVMELQALPGLAPAEEEDIWALVRSCIVIPVDESIATLSGRLKRTRAKRVSLDLLIAATAIIQHLPLLTKNPRDFRGIPGLVLLRT